MACGPPGPGPKKDNDLFKELGNFTLHVPIETKLYKSGALRGCTECFRSSKYHMFSLNSTAITDEPDARRPINPERVEVVIIWLWLLSPSAHPSGNGKKASRTSVVVRGGQFSGI